MNANLIGRYLRKVPAVICTAGSYIASVNAAAKQSFSWLCYGERLFERMSPESILKYEAHFATSRSGEAFSFTVNTPDGRLFAVAIFDSIYAKRFAEVLLFGDRDEMEAELERDFPEPTNEEKAEFASVLLGISDEGFEPCDKSGLIDLKASTAQLISKISNMGIIVLYSENDEARNLPCLPEEIPMVSYLQMIMMMVYALGNIGRSNSLRLKLCKYGKNTEVVVATDFFDATRSIKCMEELSQSFPAVAIFVSVCSYVAGICGCSLELRNDSARGELSLALVIRERPMFDVDFKSRDPLLYFEESFEFSREYILRLASDNT